MKASKPLPLLLLLISLSIQAEIVVKTGTNDKALLAKLHIRESKTPVRLNEHWEKPKTIIVRSPWVEVSPDILSGLKSVAGKAEIIVITDPDKQQDKIASADVLLGSCEQAQSSMRKLKWVQNFSAGVERCVHKPVFQENNILLTNMKGIYGPGIAEHVIAMMLTLTRGLHQFQEQQSRSEWNRKLASEYPMQEVQGKTMLVVGLGGIGTEIAWRANALGMQVTATRNSSRDKPQYIEYVGLADELFALAKKADVIVNATPLTASTAGLFDRKFFAELKRSAYFINIGRGKSVITEDLTTALRTKKLAGAALDVTEPEPLPADHELWQMPNVIITPHISGRSDQVQRRFWAFIRENLRRYTNGERILNVVNITKGY